MSAERCVLLAQIQRPIALFAQGLVGRFVHLKALSTDSDDSGASDRAGTDGDCIELPAQIDQFQLRTYNLGAYRVAALRQIGYLTEGTVDFQLAQACARIALPAPVHVDPKRSELESFFELASRPLLLRAVFLTLESARIDCVIAQRYPGARADLARVRARELADRVRVPGSATLSGLVEALVRYALGGAREGLPQALLELVEAALVPGGDVYLTAETAVRVCQTLEPRFRLRARPVRISEAVRAGSDLEEAERVSEPGDLQSLGLDFPGELILQAANARRRGGQPGSPQIATTPMLTSGAPDTATRELGRLDGLGAQGVMAAPAQPDSARSYLYDEWDYHAQRYLRSWCRVYEQRLRGERVDFIDDVHRRHGLLAQQVRRQFGFIRPEQWHRVRRTNDGDELELDGVIEAVIDRRLTGASDSQLYIRRDRALRDVAAAFLTDMSASTGFPLPETAVSTAAEPTPVAEYAPYFYGGLDEVPATGPPAPKRRVIDVAKESLALMCEALQRLGDSCAIYGFSGDGREHVEFHVAKDFRDRLGPQTWAALAAMEPLRSTRMGPAIRHALVKLLREPARMKVLIIVSDGYPQDHDYGPNRRDDNYGIEDTACALREAERAGVIAFCVTIDPAGHDYLRRMCLDSRYMVIDDVTALPRELTKIYRTLTA